MDLAKFWRGWWAMLQQVDHVGNAAAGRELKLEVQVNRRQIDLGVDVWQSSLLCF